jgi:hypothetical protein
MSTIKLPVTPLPPKPVPYEEWQLAWPDCRSAYDRVYNAEWHALQQVEANATSKETKQKLISARVAGYLLVELFNRRTILSEGPCASLVKKLISSPRVPGGTDHDLVFGSVNGTAITFYACVRSVPSLRRSASQFPCSSDIYPEVPNTLLTPFASLAGYLGGYDKGLHGSRWKRL